MAYIASDLGVAFKEVLVRVQDQSDHFPRGVLFRLVVRGVVPLTIGVDVTEIAAPAQRRREVIHHRNELRNRHVAEQLHVFLAAFLRDRFLSGSGSGRLGRLRHSQS